MAGITLATIKRHIHKTLTTIQSITNTGIELVRSRFIKYFDGKIGSIHFSPGHINLIGEHTDHNDGFVFPDVVDKGIMAEVRPNGTNTAMCYSIDLRDRAEFKVDDLEDLRATWVCLIYGMVQEFKALGVDVKGFNTALADNVSLGAGMSSSATMESCFGCALNDSSVDNKISKWDIVLTGQATGHRCIGVNCGITDQFVSVFGQEGKLMCLDCRSRESECFPFDPQGYKFVLVNSEVKHEFVGSPYNDRRRSCENVVAAVVKQFPNKKSEALCDVNKEELETVKDKVSAEDYQRAHFALGGKECVLAVYDTLVADDYETVGQKMYETHHGFSKEYEVSCEELDLLSDVAKENGVIGSRITGGDFGGCTINPVKDKLYDELIADAIEKFTAKYGHAPEVHLVVISEGLHKAC